MKAVVFHDIGDIRLEDVADPKIEAPTDAIVRITTSAICGTDLHMIRGTMQGMAAGTIMGHEGVGIVEEIGSHVRNLKEGDRVVIASTIACGYCSYCRAGYYAQCDNANPNGKLAGTAFFGGPESTGPFNGLQAERARIPFANIGLTKVPPEISDQQAILISDIFPTGYFGADLAEIEPGDTVAVLGCGPVGLFCIISAQLMDAGRIIAVDHIPSRLDAARELGAEVINFAKEDPLGMILELTGGIGVDRLIDAVGVDAQRAHQGPARPEGEKAEAFDRQVQQLAGQAHPHGQVWQPGDAPSQALEWGVQALAKAGTLAIIGVYPPTAQTFPIGAAMMKNLTINMGNCHHRRYIPLLIDYTANGTVDPAVVLTQSAPMSEIIDAYEAFDQREAGWIKVAIAPVK